MLIGIDWGGTKIEAIALTGKGETLARTRVPTPDNYEAAIVAVTDLVRGIEVPRGETASVGVGIPGAISPTTGLIKNANTVWLNGRPLERDLRDALARPVRIENDANCFAVSEAIDGAGAGARTVWGVIIGTGAGSGIAIGGQPLSGPHKVAGEWGHNPLPWPRDDERPGPSCFCGKNGCIETFVSGTGFAADHARRTGQTLRAEEIIARMRAGDAAARQTFEVYLDRLGRAVAHVVHILDPDVIVLGGGMSDIEEIYPELPSRIAPHVLAEAFLTPVRKNVHGASSGVRGAAWLWARG
jgi:fructokinase